MPGETQPCRKRSLAAIACLRIRNPDMGSEKSGKKRTLEDARLEGADDGGDETAAIQDKEAKKEDGGGGDEQEG